MSRPDLHVEILAHPNCYPGLAAWIRQVQSAGVSVSDGSGALLGDAAETGAGAAPSGKIKESGAASVIPAAASQHSGNTVPHAGSGIPVSQGQMHPQQGSSLQASYPASLQTRAAVSTSSGKKKRKKRQNATLLRTLIVAVVVVALCVAGIAGYMLWPGDSYAYGVKKGASFSIPEGAVALASAVEEKSDTVYSLVIAETDSDYEAKIVESVAGQKPKLSDVKVKQALHAVLANPSRSLCSAVDGLACRPAKRIEDTKFTWDDKVRGWRGLDKTIAADVIFGAKDGYIFGCQDAPAHAGHDDVAGVAVPSVTAFEQASGKAVWRYEFDRPSFVHVSDSGLMVVDGSQWEGTALSAGSQGAEDAVDTDGESIDGEVEPDGAAGDGPGGFAAEPDSPGGTTGIVDAFDDIYTQVDEGSIYQLVPSAKEEATMAAPIEEKKRQQRTAIRDFDLMNYYAPGIVHHPHGVGECVEYVEGQKITGHSGKTKVMVKQPIPSDDDPCWIRLHNGVGQYQFMHDFPDGNDECAPKDSATLYEDSIIYGDFDGDGYEDAAGLIQEQGCFDGGPLASIWIYNPDDPQHPDFFYQPSGSWPTLERLTIEGSDVVGHSPEGCIYFIITVTREDGELKVISNDDPNFEECLGVPTSR